MRRHTLISSFVLVVFLIVPFLAFGQDAPPVAQPGILSAKDLVWVGFASSFALFLAPFFDPANTQTPFDWAPSKRMTAFTVLGVATGMMHLFNAQTPWTTSLLVGVTTILIPAVGHLLPADAFRRAALKKAAAGAGAVTAFCLIVGCTQAQGAADLNLGKCIAARATLDVLAGDTDQQIADDLLTYCVGATVNAVNTVIPDARAQAAAIKAKAGAK